MHKLDAGKYHELDNQAYAALLALRAAQKAGTAADVTTATTNLGVAIAAIYAIGELTWNSQQSFKSYLWQAQKRRHSWRFSPR